MKEMMILNLETPIVYSRKKITLSEVLNGIMNEEDGFDSIFIYEARNNFYKLIDSGVSNLFKENNHNGNTITVNRDRYAFMQFPLQDDEEKAFEVLRPFVDGYYFFTVRVLKESKYEAVMQLII